MVLKKEGYSFLLLRHAQVAKWLICVVLDRERERVCEGGF